MEGLKTAGQVAGAFAKGVTSGSGPLGAAGNLVRNVGNTIQGVKKNVTKFYTPKKTKKTRFKKVGSKTSAPKSPAPAPTAPKM